MIHCIAIDDEPEALDVLRIHASKIPYLDLKASFRNARKAYEFLLNNKVDFIFLDINMPDISGVEFARMLTIKPYIVFTTAYSTYAVESYEVEAVDYLLKPIGFNGLVNAVQKVKNRMEVNRQITHTRGLSDSNHSKSLLIKSGTQNKKVLFDDILYVKSDGNYLTYVTRKGKIISRINMTNALAQLPSDNFIRIHKSYIISFKHIDFIESYQVGIKDQNIPIGSSYREYFNKLISKA